ncbi:hypothetical protein FSP39_002447 [Pinctada imbricata]|uniref:Ubiquinone biosynthesis protein n=1 Tax=Pinctada imbricata TaxID=66713 RepID=A0AA88Y1P1_PINIB|nr:hypothetical protein FSP39_002447 [Pinctada imbricata]
MYIPVAEGTFFIRTALFEPFLAHYGFVAIHRQTSRSVLLGRQKRLLSTHKRLLSTHVNGSDTNNGNSGEVKTDEVLIGSKESYVNEEFYEEGEEGGEETEEEYHTKERILRASLPFVHQHGWTKNAIAAGAEQEGLPSVAHGMFPRGGVELVFYLLQTMKIKTGPFIKEAVEMRLRMITPYMDKWPQAMAIQTLPQNAPEAWSNLGNLVDEIWYYAGDRSNDFNYYTKRGSLAAIYKATEIYMLQDKSDDWQDTWEFLNRRLADVNNAGKNVKNVSDRLLLNLVRLTLVFISH